jgi:hypothetical protein
MGVNIEQMTGFLNAKLSGAVFSFQVGRLAASP